MYIYFTKIFNPLLSAYRAKYGCHDVLLKFTEQWKYAIDNRLVCGALLMDLSKAFDCLPHGLLICKLNAYGFTESACKLIMSYLSNRKQRVKLGNIRSTWSSLLKGVPQGSVIGPLLFNIFFNDLYFDINKCILYNYADDNTLFHASEHLDDVLQCLREDAETAVKWYKNNGMQIHKNFNLFYPKHLNRIFLLISSIQLFLLQTLLNC